MTPIASVSRAIVSYASGRFTHGQDRLYRAASADPTISLVFFRNELPPFSPDHASNPYAFKAHALQEARRRGHTTLLWADACMVPVKPLEPLWERIERDGYWISNNGFWNSEWTTEAAYPLLGVTREENDRIPHVVAGCFGLNVASEIGSKALDMYLEFAKSGAFRGPATGGIGIQHRHDQTALSVVAYRLGMNLTNPPFIFSYPPGDQDTLLIADGAY